MPHCSCDCLRVRFKRLSVLVAAAVAARDHAQAAGVAGQVVEVESDLDVADFLLVAVGVPPGVAGVVVAVGTAVVEVVAEQAGEQALDARIVEQRAEALVLIDEGHDAGAPFAVVRLAVVAPAALGPDLLKGVGDLVDTVGHQARQREVAEGVEEVELLLVEADHVGSPGELDGGWGRRYIGGASDAVFNLIRRLSSFNL